MLTLGILPSSALPGRLEEEHVPLSLSPFQVFWELTVNDPASESHDLSQYPRYTEWMSSVKVWEKVETSLLS